MADPNAPRTGSGPDSMPAFVVAGTQSGAGKTTVTLGLLASLRHRGHVVQPFKVGPDFIDPLHHERAAGRRARTLDGWMLPPAVNRDTFARASRDADVAIVEGVMGLFDGSDGATDRGSTAEMARLLGLPVILVIGASAMARSAAAVVHGFRTFDPAVGVAGVVLNGVGGEGHAALLREAIGDSVPIIGALPRDPEITVAERHLGLTLPHETPKGYHDRLADLIESHVDIDMLLRMTSVVRPAATVAAPDPRPCAPDVRIGVVRDEAFCFYYEENLELLRAAGAEIVEFSALRGPLPEGLHGLYIGGGYPEVHAAALAAHQAMRHGIRALAGAGMPVYAECGGLMYLGRHLTAGGTAYEMCGVMPYSTQMDARLDIGYVEVETTAGLFGAGRRARGQVFHQSALVEGDDAETGRCYVLTSARGERAREGYTRDAVLASYVHLHFASDPDLAPAFVAACRAHRDSRVPSSSPH